jgi:flagellar export protein FliJ
MAQFRFRLATLLRLRESARDERRARLAEAYAAERKLLSRRDEILREQAEIKRNHRGPGVGPVNVDQLLTVDRYDVLLKAELQVIDRQQTLLAEEIEKRRQALVAADREVRLLEKFREKLAQRHRQHEATQDMKQLDELAGRRWREADD